MQWLRATPSLLTQPPGAVAGRAEELASSIPVPMLPAIPSGVLGSTAGQGLTQGLVGIALAEG